MGRSHENEVRFGVAQPPLPHLPGHPLHAGMDVVGGGVGHVDEHGTALDL